MIVDRPKYFAPVYSSWFGKPVMMLVVFRQLQIPMLCHIVGESASDVRVRVQPGWEIDVRKNLVLDIKEIVMSPEDRMN
jgi:hypothetical protein